METKTEGWIKTDNAKLWHYFRDGRSLCGKWMTFSQNYDETENIDSPDNCKACKNKRSKELSNSNPAPAKPVSPVVVEIKGSVDKPHEETGGRFIRASPFVCKGIKRTKNGNNT